MAQSNKWMNMLHGVQLAVLLEPVSFLSGYFRYEQGASGWRGRRPICQHASGYCRYEQGASGWRWRWPVFLAIVDTNKAPVADAGGDQSVNMLLAIVDTNKAPVADAGGDQSVNMLLAIVDTNKAPVADAGGDQSVNMPVSLVTLDGSKSTDDKRIVSYTWVKNVNSLAAGVSRGSVCHCTCGTSHSDVYQQKQWMVEYSLSFMVLVKC